MGSDKAPWIITLALAIIGWASNSIIERVTGAPTLEYTIDAPVPAGASAPKDARILRVHLTNLTRATTFKDFAVVFMSPPGTTIVGELTEIHPLPPAFEGNEPWRHRGGMATYVVPKMLPGWQFVAQVGYVGPHPPALRFESGDTVYATPPTWETKYVRNEIWFLGSFGALWAVIVVIYIFRSLRNPSTAASPAAPTAPVAASAPVPAPVASPTAASSTTGGGP
jgi:hypothetical protein